MALPDNFFDTLHSRFVQAGDLELHCVETGPADGYPVILLHGFPEYWYTWRFQMIALAEAGYRVIVPDQRGYNLSEKKGPYNLETLARDIAHLQDALGIRCSAIVGHDWGGIVAWAFASYFPERTACLVALNAPHPNAYLDACRALSLQVFRSWYIYAFQIPRLPEFFVRLRNYAGIRRLFKELPPQNMTPQDIDRYITALDRPGALRAAINWYRALPAESIRTGGSLPEPVIQAPTCVIWGEDDFALDIACLETLPKYVPDLRLHQLAATSHWVQIHRPGAVNAHLVAFLDEKLRQAAV